MISVTRGDTLPLELEILKPDKTQYELQEGDELVFTLKKETSIDSPIILQKKADPSMGMYFELQPHETELDYGNYWFDVELTTSDKRRYTVIKPTKLKVTKEVTTHGES